MAIIRIDLGKLLSAVVLEVGIDLCTWGFAVRLAADVLVADKAKICSVQDDDVRECVDDPGTVVTRYAGVPLLTLRLPLAGIRDESRIDQPRNKVDLVLARIDCGHVIDCGLRILSDAFSCRKVQEYVRTVSCRSDLRRQFGHRCRCDRRTESDRRR